MWVLDGRRHLDHHAAQRVDRARDRRGAAPQRGDGQLPQRLDPATALVKNYSEFVPFPIKMRQPPSEDEEERAWARANEAEAIWRRSKSEVEDEEYRKFFAHLDPLAGEPMTLDPFSD